MTQTWKKAEEPLGTPVDTGDILEPLKRVQDQYIKCAQRHEKAGHPEYAEYYYEQAKNINSLVEPII